MRNGFVTALVVILVVAFSVFGVGLYLRERPKTQPTTNVSHTQSPTANVKNSSEHEIEIANSTNYSFKWNKLTKKVSITESGNELYNFSLAERPLAAWVYKPNNTIAIVTSAEESLAAPHSLYIVKNDTPRKVIEGKEVKLSESFSSKTHLYDYWDYYDPEKYRQNINNALTFSPDGMYLFVTLLEYESVGPASVNLHNYSVVEDEGLGTNGPLYWSPSGKCAFNYASFYGDSHEVVLAKLVNGIFVTRMPKDVSLVASSVINIYWQNDCTGFAYLETQNLDNYQEEKHYYRFDYDSNTFTKKSIVPDITSLKESKGPEQENIFFTVVSEK